MAQTRVSGRVNDNNSKPLSNASVLILNAKDSSMVKGAASDAAGEFAFTKVPAGKYLAVVSSASYADQYVPVFEVHVSPVDLGNIILQPSSSELKSVVVSAKKPMFEQKIDRMVINVKNSITSAGGTVLEVLEKSPGVTVNRGSGAIALNGKDGVMVMINGKINYLPAESLVQVLNGMNAANVEKIELITTPPAKYDAAGNAGYINIVLVTNPDEGFNGSYNLSMGVGNGTYPKASVNFNYRKKKINLYGSYDYSRLAQIMVFSNYRKVEYNGNVLENSVTSNRDPYQRNHIARLGMDYSINKKTVMGVLVSGYNNKWEMDAVNTSENKKNGVLDTSILIKNHEINHKQHVMGNLNIQHRIREGDDVSINTDYLYYDDNNPTEYDNAYYDKSGNYMYSENTTSSKKTIINIWVSQVDYNKKINEKIRMEMGAKASFSKFTNDVLVQKEEQDVWVPDPRYTSKYYLKENISAAYVSMDLKMSEKTSFKGGLRYEYTNSNLGSDTEKDIVDRHYGKLFPTFYVSHKLNESNTINFSYNKRINRPSYTQLAPFLIFFDPKTFITGNPALQPAISNGVKLDYIFKKFVFTASYTHEDNTISRFQPDIDSVSNIMITAAQNLDYSKLFYISVSAPVKVTSWWNSQVNLSANWNKIRALIKEEGVVVSQFYFGVNWAESFNLPREISIELSGFYQSKFLFGANLVQPIGQLNVAIQKKFKEGTRSLTLGADNLLNTMKIHSEFSVPEQNIQTKANLQFSYPLYKITWNQNFGNKLLKDKRRRSTASEEERSRVE
jgi:hypothetical protein